MPLSEQEQAQAQELINAGKPKDQVFKFILQRRGGVTADLPAAPRMMTPEEKDQFLQGASDQGIRIGRFLGGIGAPPTSEEAAFAQANPGRYARSQTLPLAGAVAGGIGGRYVGGMIPALQRSGIVPAVGRLALSVAGESLGAGTGVVGSQVLGGESPDLDEAKRVAALQALFSGGTGLLAPLLGVAGGVSPKNALEAVARPDFVRTLPPSAQADLALEAHQTARDMPLSEGRQKLVKIIDRQQTAGKFVDGEKMLAAATAAMPDAPTREAESATNMFTEDLARVEQRMAQVAGANRRMPGARGMKLPLTPTQADEILRTGLTEPVADEFNSTSGGSEYVKTRKAGRNLAAQEFYGTLGPDAVEAAGQAHEALNERGAVMDTFKVDKYGDPMLNAPGRIAAIDSPANRSAPVIRQKLARFDARNKTNLLAKADALAAKADWGPNDQRTASYISSMVFAQGQQNTGALRNLMRSIARGAVRSQGMVGAAARAYFANAMGGKEKTP